MRRARRRGKDGLGALLIVAAFAVLAGLAGAAMLLRPPPTDPETLCRTDQPPAQHVFILVDATDKLEPRHRRVLQAVVRQEGQRLARYDRLTLAALRADRPQEPRLLFSLCNPGDGQSVNPLIQNTRMAQERWQEAFGDQLDRALRRAGSGRGARASPIIAGLRAVAADPEFAPGASARRLVLISDLLEYAPNSFSLYDETATFAAWRNTGAALPDLSGVSLRITPLDRPEQSAAQANATQQFWPAFLDAAGARRVDIDPHP